MFETISAAPPDPILGLSETYLADPRANKINLTIGVYRDEQGNTPVLECVKQAEARLLAAEVSKGYLGMEGLPEFGRLAAELSLGGIVPLERIAVTQTPGGTGALKVAADFLSANFRGSKVWLSTPTWPNHHAIFETAGLDIAAYPYLSGDRKSLDFDALLGELTTNARRGDIVCLHACCHNPTGIDPTAEQWAELAATTRKLGLLPLVDFAYHGFGEGLKEDLVGIRAIAEQHSEFLVCSSFSKNFGLYSERAGALHVVCELKTAVAPIASRVKEGVRSNYSNPPRHGGAVVATVLADKPLRALWESELAAMRARINEMRQQFVQAMSQTDCDVDFSFLLDQRGMFSFSGLTPMQVDWLKSERGIYIVGSGRINVAGITPSNLASLAAAVAEATKI